jgi:hypothetical protein
LGFQALWQTLSLTDKGQQAAASVFPAAIETLRANLTQQQFAPLTIRKNNTAIQRHEDSKLRIQT